MINYGLAMSLGELLVIIIVGLLVLKPEDLPKIAAKIRELKNFIDDAKKSFLSSFDVTNDLDKSREIQKDVDQINFYLAKILSLGKEYEGDYSLTSIKDYYRSIIQNQISKSKKLEKMPKKPSEKKKYR